MKTKLLIFALIIFSAMMSSCGSSRETIRGSEAEKNIENGNFSARENREGKGKKKSKKDEDKKDLKKLQKDMIKYAKTWIGTPYLYGGNSKNGIDCSGFTCQVFKEVAKVKLPRTSRDQAKYCEKIDRKKIKPGDLVFFSSKKGGSKITHVALYIGDNQIIHASSSKGVTISSLDEKYWSTHLHHFGRVKEVFR